MALNEVYETIEHFERRAKELAVWEMQLLFKARHETDDVLFLSRYNNTTGAVNALAMIGLIDSKQNRRYLRFAGRVQTHNIRWFLKRRERRERVDRVRDTGKDTDYPATAGPQAGGRVGEDQEGAAPHRDRP
jgi:hypothetical protein